MSTRQPVQPRQPEERGRVTERKPAGMSFTSWIDQQINEAAERGLFEDLPGAGKPLPKRDEADAARAWLRDYLRREGLPTQEVLPTPLRLRKEREVLAEAVPALRSEQEVRQAAGALNDRIMQWRRLPLDSPIFVPLVDEEQLVAAWRQAQPESEPNSVATPDGPGQHIRQRASRQWWPRRRRR